MSARDATVTSFDAIPPRGYYEQHPAVDWLPVRHELGMTSFGLNAWRASDAGEPLIEPHDELDPPIEEAYLVVRGRATFWLGEQHVDAPTGTVLRVGPSEHRRADAAEPDTIVLAIGESHAPSAWETRALEANPPRG